MAGLLMGAGLGMILALTIVAAIDLIDRWVARRRATRRGQR